MSLADVAHRDTITVEEAAQVLGISRKTAYEAAQRGELPVLRFGRRLLVPTHRLRALLEGPPTDDDVFEVARNLDIDVSGGQR